MNRSNLSIRSCVAGYTILHQAAKRRGHANRTTGAALGGLLGATVGSFAGPVGAGIGAGLGGLLGAHLGGERDR